VPKGVYARKKNTYRIEDGVVYMDLSRRDGSVLVTRFDARHLDRVLAHPFRWCAAYDQKMRSYYVRTLPVRPEGDTTRGGTLHLHRLITGAPPGTQVDHDDHDTLNNLDNNLIVTTPSLNGLNRRGPNQGSSSGYRNVHATRKPGRWRVHFRGKYLGTYGDPAVAAAVAAQAWEEYRASLL